MISDDADRKLCATYPEFFRVGKNGQFGFECGQGWMGIIESLCKSLKEKLEQNPTEKIRFIQIKEKLGTLRLYHSNSNPVMCALVNQAEEASSKVCEVCGASGSLISTEGWLRTRCPDHTTPPERVF